MALPMVAILGRPNVGKSSLFNALVRSRVAIVDPTAGVTRDRVSMVLRAGEGRCELIDTGGIGIVDQAGLEEEIENQIDIAVHEADILVFVVDVQAGILPADREIVRRLRRLEKPLLLVANKADAPSHDHEAAQFFGLGIGDPIPIAANTSRGVGDLRDRIGELIPELPPAEESNAIRLAVVGRTNAGKSTLVNQLVGEERMIVSDVPGTTRDAVDLRFVHDDQEYVVVDTAGIRKRKAVSGTADFYGQARAERAIRRCEVVLFLVDAVEPIARIERNIAAAIVEAHRPVIVVLSKWDLVEGKTLADYEEYVQANLPNLGFAPITCLSSHENFHLRETLSLAREMREQSLQRMTTAQILKIIRAGMTRRGPPVKGGRTGKIFFASQIDVQPPTIVLFVNDARCMTDPYMRYLAGIIREHGPFPEVPIRLLIRERRSRSESRGR